MRCPSTSSSSQERSRGQATARDSWAISTITVAAEEPGGHEPLDERSRRGSVARTGGDPAPHGRPVVTRRHEPSHQLAQQGLVVGVELPEQPSADWATAAADTPGRR